MRCWKKRARPRWMLSGMATEFAPAKINLTLHVTGQRADGYHLLDSLVVFAGVGDQISATLGSESSLAITGPKSAGLLPDGDNLVLRAAAVLGVTAALRLEKVLPVASGIGGGSADAAATLRLLSRLSGRAVADGMALSLGADVPVCMAQSPVRMTGVGDGIAAVTGLPPAWLVLVNSGHAVRTPDVFRALTRRDHPPMPETLPVFANTRILADFLRGMRNDLEPPAIALQPVIAQAKAALAATDGCLIARMSGSGATCFGLYEDEVSAQRAAANISAAHPSWWVAAAPVL